MPNRRSALFGRLQHAEIVVDRPIVIPIPSVCLSLVRPSVTRVDCAELSSLQQYNHTAENLFLQLGPGLRLPLSTLNFN